MKDSEKVKHLLELAKPFLKDQTEEGSLARTILAGYRMLVRTERRLEAAKKEYEMLKMREGVKKHGKDRAPRGKKRDIREAQNEKAQRALQEG